MKAGIGFLMVAAVLMAGFSSSRWMSRADGSRQCEPFDFENSLASVKQELSKAGLDAYSIEHVPADKSSGMRMALCGSPTGGSYKIRVGGAQAEAASRLGFKEVRGE